MFSCHIVNKESIGYKLELNHVSKDVLFGLCLSLSIKFKLESYGNGVPQAMFLLIFHCSIFIKKCFNLPISCFGVILIIASDSSSELKPISDNNSLANSSIFK